MTTNPAPHAVTFDLWLTLMFEESTGRHELRVNDGVNALADSGIAVDPQALGDAIRTVGRTTSAEHDRGFDRPFEERMAQILDAAHPTARAAITDTQFEAFSRAIDEPFLVHSPTIYPEAQSVLRAVRDKGVRTALISNVGSTSPDVYRRFLDREGIGSELEYLTFSNQIASAKPAAEMFTHTLEQLGVAPENALHVGDNLHADIGGAKDVGMSAVWIKGHDQREPRVRPDYTISGLSELPDVVDRWLEGS
ncbi:MAG: HAD family hydrolase [Chloroflexi bacterium]|jgi:HAD superfamily hydrolase (TIGR01509 family)|nr:HAD family hydrolase [Chloroflexota bacterium]MBT5319174.1 HAD family hydrolase [Chloroflexota bacterium]MBT6681254.1 HAD family hydrolase [Chloroflexota bacterium]